MEFTSTNPYQSIVPIVADDPAQLVDLIKQIKTPVKIVAITTFGTKQVAYIMGDVRISEMKTKKSKG